jgi:two-component system response regulator QseB
VTLAGKPVELSPREYAILLALLEGAGRALSREQLEQGLYGWGDEVESNAVEVHIHHLRKKLGAELIRTIRGVGYLVDKA